MVIMSLVFSQYTFFVSLKNLLYPKQIVRDKYKNPVRLENLTRCTFYVSEIVALSLLFGMSFYIFWFTEVIVDTESLKYYIVSICEIPLVILQIITLVYEIIIFKRLRLLRKQRPDCA